MATELRVGEFVFHLDIPEQLPAGQLKLVALPERLSDDNLADPVCRACMEVLKKKGYVVEEYSYQPSTAKKEKDRGKFSIMFYRP